ncbi:MAG TPA: hypothetical protein VN844_30130 [Pyrinomonadaceae bacterium]|nr:hypothetical protein [Pyrinomonadaceae bacterium]
MNLRRLSIGSLLVTALLLTAGGFYYATSTVTAQEKQANTSNTEASKTPTGFVTGTKCTKTGSYKASNKYLELILTVEEGAEFPPFADGEKTTWYALTPNTKDGFEPVKVAPGTN